MAGQAWPLVLSDGFGRWIGVTTLTAHPVQVRAELVARPCRRPRDPSAAPPVMMQIHEALLGRQTWTIARNLDTSQWWPTERLREAQITKLRRIVRHAAARCPYWCQRRLPTSRTLHQPEDLCAIGLLTREELRRHARRMCWPGMPAKRLVDFTRGTTDERMAYYWDRRRQAWDKANRLRGHGWHGFSPGDRELHLWPVDPPVTFSARWKDWLRRRRDECFGEMQIDSLKAFGASLAATWQAWRRFDPVRVTAYPSALVRLILDGRGVGCSIGNPSLRCVFLTGEVTHAWQRELIELALGVPTVQDYGVQEVGSLAFSCDHGHWHMAAESALIEIIRDGRPAAPGELGEVVVTGLESLAMPMLRYCTGDIVRAGAARCDCGRGLPVMPPVLGRASDFLEAKDGDWIEPARVVESLGQVLEHNGYQVMQRSDGRIEVHVVTPPDRSGWKAEVRDRISRFVGKRTPCTIQRMADLRRSMFGKCRYVFSQRTLRGLALRQS